MSRILHCLNLDTIGGVESIFGDYLRHDSSATHDHHLMILNRRCHDFFRDAVNKRITSILHSKYVGPFRIPKSLRSSWSTYWCKRLLPDIQIIYNTLDNEPAWSAAQYAGKCIYYERGAAWLCKSKDGIVAKNLAKVDRFFCNSWAAKRVLKLRFDVDASQCDVIYNPLRLSDAFTSKAASQLFPKTNYKVDADVNLKFRIGMAGRLIPVKGMVIGLHALAELLKRSPQFELYIAGQGPEREMLDSVARGLGITHAVKFLGTVNDMTSFYSNLDVFVCPSLREPLGNVAIEANGCGCPVICTNVDGLPEAITHDYTGWCIAPSLSDVEYFSLGVFDQRLPELVYDPVSDSLTNPRALSPQHLAESIWTLFERPSLKSESAENSILSANERFSMIGYVDQFHHSLNAVLS
jgi:glycosyltransferase involved in cell wall biosynthesis